MKNKRLIRSRTKVADGVGWGCCAVTALCSVALLTLSAHAMPSGGQVAAGQAVVSQPTTNRMQIDQSSNRAVINWNSFGIAANEAVKINQPSSSSVLLNRVLGNSPSAIFGQLSANGQLFLINPAGVLFAPGASVNVGGVVASSLTMKDDDFMAGAYHFAREGSAGSVVNRGEIKAGFAALLGPTVENSGAIITARGSAALGAADSITLNFDGNGLIALKLEKGAYGALVTNSGVIEADGGRILLTAKSADNVMKSMVNTTGRLQARTVEQRSGEILLMGDMSNGAVQVGGTLDASAPAGGNGGFVESSAARVRVLDSARITTMAPQGRTGSWLLDPNDITIAGSGGDLTGGAVSNALTTTNVTVSTASQGTAGGNGDIFVNDAIGWGGNRLTLAAGRNISINAPLNGTGAAQLALEYGQLKVAGGNSSGYSVNAPVSLPAGNNFSTKLGSDGLTTTYAVITGLGAEGSSNDGTLQGMQGNLAAHYALGSDIIATATQTWNSGAGFTPVGNNTTKFSGVFEGLGHTISDLTINRGTTNYVGLFGYTDGATIKNVGLLGGTISGDFEVGGLVGYSHNSTINNSSATGVVSGSNSVGGLVGWNDTNSVIANSHATGSVSGSTQIGGLAGQNFYYSSISNSYATGAVSGSSQVGGLVGYNFYNSSITNSYATGAVSAGTLSKSVGGLVGYNFSSSITNSYATGGVSAGTGSDSVGGLIGGNDINSSITNSYAAGWVSAGTGSNSVGGLVGNNAFSTINNSYWDAQTTGQATSSGSNPSYGRTTSEMKSLAIFSGWDIDGNGGSGKIWRIYEGQTYPLLRSFLTPLTVTANDAGKSYDSLAYSGGNGVSYSSPPNGNLLGTLTYGGNSQGAINAGSNYNIIPKELYSNQQGYDISFANGFLTIGKANLTITAATNSKSYDGGSSAAAPPTVSGIMGSDSVSGLTEIGRAHV